MSRTGSPIILFQALSKSVGFYPDDCVLLGVEVARPAERFKRDAVLLNPIALASEMAIANVLEELPETWRFRK